RPARRWRCRHRRGARGQYASTSRPSRHRDRVAGARVTAGDPRRAGRFPRLVPRGDDGRRRSKDMTVALLLASLLAQATPPEGAASSTCQPATAEVPQAHAGPEVPLDAQVVERNTAPRLPAAPIEEYLARAGDTVDA